MALLTILIRMMVSWVYAYVKAYLIVHFLTYSLCLLFYVLIKLFLKKYVVHNNGKTSTTIAGCVKMWTGQPDIGLSVWTWEGPGPVIYFRNKFFCQVTVASRS